MVALVTENAVRSKLVPGHYSVNLGGIAASFESTLGFAVVGYTEDSLILAGVDEVGVVDSALVTIASAVPVFDRTDPQSWFEENEIRNEEYGRAVDGERADEWALDLSANRCEGSQGCIEVARGADTGVPLLLADGVTNRLLLVDATDAQTLVVLSSAADTFDLTRPSLFNSIVASLSLR